MRVTAFYVEVTYTNGVFIDSFHITTHSSGSTNEIARATMIAQYRLPEHMINNIVETQLDIDKKFIKILIKG